VDKTLRILILEDNPADAELVQFELVNLLANALKFTRKNKKTVIEAGGKNIPADGFGRKIKLMKRRHFIIARRERKDENDWNDARYYSCGG
jgi:hypothetical protein